MGYPTAGSPVILSAAKDLLLVQGGCAKTNWLAAAEDVLDLDDHVLAQAEKRTWNGRSL